MPTFSTPTPIDLAINLQVGRLDVIASDRADTVVTVQPTSHTKAVDRRGAEQTKVDFDTQRLTVTGPRPRLSWIGPTESVDITVELPTGSRLTAEVAAGAVRTVGRLGATRIKAMTGQAEVDATADLWLRVGHGSATLGTAEGDIEITADHGQIRIGTVTGDASLKASHGSIQIGESGGDLEAKLSYGDLDITRAVGSVSAKTAYGNIRLGEVSSGSIEVETAYGQVSIGVRTGIPAWLDVASREGRVRNALTGDAAPAPTEQTVAVRARTQYGDIDITRTDLSRTDEAKGKKK